MKKIKTIEKKYIVGVVLIFLGCLIVTSIIWGNRTFSVKTLNQIIFHLKVPLDGTNMEVVTDGENRCVPIAIVMFLMMTAFLLGMKNKKKAIDTTSIRKLFIISPPLSLELN